MYACCYCVVYINNYCLLYSEEGIEGDVVRNPTTAEDDPETKVRLLSYVSCIHDCRTIIIVSLALKKNNSIIVT